MVQYCKVSLDRASVGNVFCSCVSGSEMKVSIIILVR